MVRKLSDRAKYFAKDGNVNQAKYASTIIALDSSRPGCSDNLVDVRSLSLCPRKTQLKVIPSFIGIGKRIS